MSDCKMPSKHEILKSYGIGGCPYCKIDELEAQVDVLKKFSTSSIVCDDGEIFIKIRRDKYLAAIKGEGDEHIR